MISPPVKAGQYKLMRNFDLHCHSNFSDGVLSPQALVERAAEKGVDVLALTDHDATGGLKEAEDAALLKGISLVPGVEISVTWGGLTVHVIGLRIDPENAALQQGLLAIQLGRIQRAERISLELQKSGIKGALDGATALATNPRLIGRTHFARYLVAKGAAKDVRSVFKHFLVKGRAGYVEHHWTTLENAVGWIHGGGGQAVLAHPARYDLKTGKLKRLLCEFKELSGEGIEVVSGSHTHQHMERFAVLAAEFDFLASRGSDFHAPGEGGREIGGGPALPENVTPIWHNWKLS
jgi:3',5'-nucleoside bisphosphate phosphatase